MLQTLPNNLNPMSATNMGALDMGLGGGSAMTQMFHLPQTSTNQRVTTKSKDGMLKSNSNAILSPSQATVQRLKK